MAIVHCACVACVASCVALTVVMCGLMDSQMQMANNK
jgi:hypothetical protein